MKAGRSSNHARLAFVHIKHNVPVAGAPQAGVVVSNVRSWRCRRLVKPPPGDWIESPHRRGVVGRNRQACYGTRYRAINIGDNDLVAAGIGGLGVGYAEAGGLRTTNMGAVRQVNPVKPPLV